MNVLFHTSGADAAAWLDALSRALPEATLFTWPHASRPALDYALLWRPPPPLLASLSDVKAIFNLGAGVDSLLSLPERPRHVPLIRLEDAGMGEQMAEYVAYAVLRRYREFDVYAQSQSEVDWRPRKRLNKSEFEVGILGVGVLGTVVAQALAALRFPLRGWSRTRKSTPGVRMFDGPAGLQPFLAASRLLVCLLPLTPDTRGVLDRSVLSRLPRGAYLVNVSRGGLLVEHDLLALIDSGHLFGALLDVFHDEPLPASHAFWHHPRITVTPHVAAVTKVEDSVAQIAAKIRALEAGAPVSGIVDDTRLY